MQRGVGGACRWRRWKREILVLIPKEQGNPDREKLKPLKLQEVLRKAILGIAMRRLMNVLMREGLLNDMQHGFLPGSDMSMPLLLLRFAIDHCN